MTLVGSLWGSQVGVHLYPLDPVLLMKNSSQCKMVQLDMKIKTYDLRTRTNKEGTAAAAPPAFFKSLAFNRVKEARDKEEESAPTTI